MNHNKLSLKEIKKIIFEEEFRRFPYLDKFKQNPYTYCKARYYMYRGNKHKAKELFEQWQDLRMSMPISTKGKYKRNRLTFKEWTAGLKHEL